MRVALRALRCRRRQSLAGVFCTVAGSAGGYVSYRFPAETEKRHEKAAPEGAAVRSDGQWSGYPHVDGAQLAGVFGVGFRVEAHMLTLRQIFEAVSQDGGEVDEHVAAAVVVGDEPKSLCLILPYRFAYTDPPDT